METKSLTIGVLALQGNFAAHGKILEQCGVTWMPIRKPELLHLIDGLIIPGGESSALLKLMAPLNFMQAIKEFHARGKAIFGTCAGMILLAKQVEPEQNSLGLIDIKIARNAYGRQLDSFVEVGDVDKAISDDEILEMVFIRAPKIIDYSNEVDILGKINGGATLAQQKNILVAAFHPEQTGSAKLHEYFLTLC